MKPAGRWLFIAIFVFCIAPLSSRETPGDPLPIQTVESMNQPATLWNVNRLSGWIREDGMSGNDPGTGSSGVTYPRFTADIVYQDGLVWGGIVHNTREPGNPRMLVGGQTFRVGTQAGHILTPGTATTAPVAIDDNDPLVDVYRIRRDWQNLTVTSREIIHDAAEFLGIDTSAVTPAEAQAILDDYAADWTNWPVDQGAPWYDHNGNGQYDPGVDEPGLAGADQVLFLVVNDLDPIKTFMLYGSTPIGLEVQMTMWAYDRDTGMTGNTVFQRYRIINKSGFAVDSMFVSRWMDSDVGDYTNDLVGCDPARNLGFGYNGFSTDSDYQSYGLTPPAVGVALLQGPIVPSPGDTAIFNMTRRPGYRNLPATSFGYFSAGAGISDPPFSDYNGTLAWYNLLNGFQPTPDTLAPTPFVHRAGPDAGVGTRFPLDGDPVTGSGDVDAQGNNLPPGDRRFNISAGPFTLADGDTQEVVFALIAGMGGNHLDAVENIRQYGDDARELHEGLYEGSGISLGLRASVSYQPGGMTRVRFEANTTEPAAIVLTVVDADDQVVDSLALFDDGQHDDGAAGDGQWANTWETAPRPTGLSVNARVERPDGQRISLPDAIAHLTTAGPVTVHRILIGSDNGNGDGRVNPGENIRYTVEIENGSDLTFGAVEIAQIEALPESSVTDLLMPNGPQVLATMPANATISWPYLSSDPFFQAQILDSHPPGDSIRFVFRLADTFDNRWTDTVAVGVEPYGDPPRDFLATKIRGAMAGRLGFRIFDPPALTGHTYDVEFTGSDANGDPVYSLTDITLAETLLVAQPYPDPFPHNSTPVDGFLITRGTTRPEDLDGWNRSGTPWVQGVDWGGRYFDGGADWGGGFRGSTIDSGDVVPVKIVFDGNLSTVSAVYRRDLGYTYAGLGVFPGAAYDISIPAQPRRVNVAFVETNAVAPPNLVWDMGWDGSVYPDIYGAREYLLIMDSDYDSLDAGGYDDVNNATTADVHWYIWPSGNPDHDYLSGRMELFLFGASGADPAGTVYRFTPDYAAGIAAASIARTFALLQNYPNPFNPETTIEFSLASSVETRLDIFNVLGQRVATLAKGPMTAGHYRLRWDGRNGAGIRVASGMYFYRLEAGNFVKTRRMLLIR